MYLDCIKMNQLLVSLFIILIAGFACCKNLGGNVSKHPNKSNGLGIIGGRPIPITKYPYMVAMERDASDSAAGVLVNDRWIMTEIGNTEVVAYLDIYVGSSVMGEGHKVGVERVVIHPNYTGFYEYDVALIKIVKPLKLNKKVKPIKLATDDLPAGAVGSTAGWGVTSEVVTSNFKINQNGLGTGSEDSSVLLAADITVMKDAGCKKAYGSWFNDHIFCQTMEQVGPSLDDAGCPLVVNNTLYGMYVGGLYNKPSVYVKASSIAEWVKETIKEK